MPKIIPIVEGSGEELAIAKLIYKVLIGLERYDVQVGRPINAKGCSNIKKVGGLEQWIRYAALESDCKGVLVLVDSDEDCPKKLAGDFVRRIQAMGIQQSVGVVVANREYEAWFLASLESIAGEKLDGQVTFPSELRYPGDVEIKRGVKEWLSRHLPSSRIYKETTDQPAMTQMIDIELAKSRSRSFRRLCHAVEEMAAAMDGSRVVVTPALPTE